MHKIISPLLLVTLVLPAAAYGADTPQTWEKSSGFGTLTVRTDSVAVGTVARGATHIPMLKIHLEASCDSDVTVDEIVLQRVGLGSAEDILGVYLTGGFRRYSRVATPDRRRGETRLRLRGAKVPKCGILTLETMMDLHADAAAGGEHAFTIGNVYDVHSTAETTILYPQDDGSRIKTSPQASGIINVRFLSGVRRLRYGSIETVARLQLSTDSREDHRLRKITFTNEGKARDGDLQRLRLEDTRGNILTNVVARMDGRTVTLTFDPTFTLRRNMTKLFLLKAQIYGSYSDTVQFILEEAGDLQAESARIR